MIWRYNHLTCQFLGERDDVTCEITLHVKIHKKQLLYLKENEEEVMRKYTHERAVLIRNIHAATGMNANFRSQISLEDPGRGHTMGALRVVVRLPYPYPSVTRALVQWRANFIKDAKNSGFNDNGTRRRVVAGKKDGNNSSDNEL